MREQQALDWFSTRSFRPGWQPPPKTATHLPPETHLLTHFRWEPNNRGAIELPWASLQEASTPHRHQQQHCASAEWFALRAANHWPAGPELADFSLIRWARSGGMSRVLLAARPPQLHRRRHRHPLRCQRRPSRPWTSTSATTRHGRR